MTFILSSMGLVLMLVIGSICWRIVFAIIFYGGQFVARHWRVVLGIFVGFVTIAISLFVWAFMYETSVNDAGLKRVTQAQNSSPVPAASASPTSSAGISAATNKILDDYLKNPKNWKPVEVRRAELVKKP